MSDNMLKREFKTRDVQRMRNIITKQHGDKTGVQVGYSKEYVERKEGDEWEVQNHYKVNSTILTCPTGIAEPRIY